MFLLCSTSSVIRLGPPVVRNGAGSGLSALVFRDTKAAIRHAIALTFCLATKPAMLD